MFKRAKALHALDRAATVMGIRRRVVQIKRREATRNTVLVLPVSMDVRSCSPILSIAFMLRMSGNEHTMFWVSRNEHTMFWASRNEHTCSGCLETSNMLRGFGNEHTCSGCLERAYMFWVSRNEHTCSGCLETSNMLRGFGNEHTCSGCLERAYMLWVYGN
jgi:hypothetical protein